MKDERVIQTSNKIWSETGKIIFLFAMVAFFTKILFLRMSLADCVVECTILIGTPVYQLIRCWQLKLRVYRPVSRKRFWIREISAATVAVVIYMVVFLGGSAQAIGEKSVTLLVFAVALVLSRLVILHIDKKRSDQLDKELEDPKDGEDIKD